MSNEKNLKAGRPRRANWPLFSTFLDRLRVQNFARATEELKVNPADEVMLSRKESALVSLDLWVLRNFSLEVIDCRQYWTCP